MKGEEGQRNRQALLRLRRAFRRKATGGLAPESAEALTQFEKEHDIPNAPEAMPYRTRVANYHRQNGCRRLTPAQRRRSEHKKHHRAAMSRKRRRAHASKG